MIERTLNEFIRAKNRIAGDFKSIIGDSEDLLRSAALVTDEGFAEARNRFEMKLKNAKVTLADATQPILERTRDSAAYANHYVHNNPWAAIGVALGAGILIGFLTAKR